LHDEPDHPDDDRQDDDRLGRHFPAIEALSQGRVSWPCRALGW
jgi:hypothetical protein